MEIKKTEFLFTFYQGVCPILSTLSPVPTKHCWSCAFYHNFCFEPFKQPYSPTRLNSMAASSLLFNHGTLSSRLHRAHLPPKAPQPTILSCWSTPLLTSSASPANLGSCPPFLETRNCPLSSSVSFLLTDSQIKRLHFPTTARQTHSFLSLVSILCPHSSAPLTTPQGWSDSSAPQSPTHVKPHATPRILCFLLG